MTVIYEKDGDKIEILSGKASASITIPNEFIREAARNCNPIGHGFHGDVEGKRLLLMKLPPGRLPDFPPSEARKIFNSTFNGSLVSFADATQVRMKVGEETTVLTMMLHVKAEITQSAIRPNDPETVAHSFIEALLRQP